MDQETQAIFQWISEYLANVTAGGRPIRGAVFCLIDESGDTYCESRLRGSYRTLAIGALAELQYSLIADHGEIVMKLDKEDDNGHSGNRPE